MKVLFDNNVFADIAENRLDAQKHLPVLEEAISDGTITIVASIEVLSEIILAFQTDKDAFKRRKSIFYKLVDRQYALKAAVDIFHDEIKSIARKGENTNPFISPSYKFYDIITDIFSDSQPTSDELLMEMHKSLTKLKEDFRDLINTFGEDWYGKATFPPCFTFEQWWEETLQESRLCKSPPKQFIFNFAKELNCGYSCLGNTMDKLLSCPTILLPVGFYFESAFNQIVNGRREKPSVNYDFKHAIHAGAIGTFITGDKALRKTIHNIPGHSVNVYTLDEFVYKLNNQL